MMKLLIPLGLLGLIGIIILIIIYLIKPNYQQKMISTTFIWKLSLKYRKKRLPTSKLRNILLIICQVLIITACAFIMAKPAQVFQTDVKQKEVIAILDSSASMRTSDGMTTRYERAIDEIKYLANDIFNEGGCISVIEASSTCSFLIERASLTRKVELEDLLTELSVEKKCTYASADIEAAIDLCENILMDNPNTQIYLMTDTNYGYVPKGITVKNVSSQDEWNAGIINAYTVFNDNYYDIIVEVACYGRDQEIEVNVNAIDINPITIAQSGGNLVTSYDSVSFSHDVYCSGDQIQRVVFRYQLNGESDSENCEYVELGESYKIYSYKSIIVSIDEQDSYELDDSFAIYGGEKETIKVQYYSSSPNTFVNGALYVLVSNFADHYDIRLTEVKDDGKHELKLEGYDLYIFEHKMPDRLPIDGVVLLFDPDTAPSNSGFNVSSIIDLSKKSVDLFADDEEHPIMRKINANDITISRYVKLSAYDPSYHVLMSYDSQPMLMVKNEANSKVVVMNFSVHYSNIAVKVDFPILFKNIFEYFFPYMVENNSFEVYDKINVSTRGEKIVVNYGTHSDEILATVNPETGIATASFNAYEPNTYNITQETDFGDIITESVYVRIPKSESNIHDYQDSLPEPYQSGVVSDVINDLLFYFAIALVALLFIEWWLKSRESI